MDARPREWRKHRVLDSEATHQLHPPRAVSKCSEEAKSAVRAHRQAALTGLKKADGSEEERERAKQRLQAVVDEAVADIDRRTRRGIASSALAGHSQGTLTYTQQRDPTGAVRRPLCMPGCLDRSTDGQRSRRRMLLTLRLTIAGLGLVSSPLPFVACIVLACGWRCPRWLCTHARLLHSFFTLLLLHRLLRSVSTAYTRTALPLPCCYQRHGGR